MQNITSYLLTILSVFVLLSAVFILINFIRFILTLRDERRKQNINKTLYRNKPILNIKYNDIYEENKKTMYKLDGEKTCRYDNGDIYKGEFIDGKKSGFGICIFANKERYEGLWKDDKMHSVGKYTFSDGGIYSGDFKDGVIEGLGMYTYPNKDIY
ncbi:hypothetical protein CHF27_012245, partial [Romboutsia maritimum]